MIVLRENQKTGFTIAGQKRLGQDSGLRQRTVQHLLPALHRAGVVRQIKRRNKTALRSVDASILPMQPECTHSLPQSAPVCESRAKPWIRHMPTAPEPPPSASPDSPAGGELTPQKTPKILTPQIQSSPTVARLGAAPCGSPGNKKEKPSLEEGNGLGFSGRFLKLTPEEERQVEELIPSCFERTVQFTALDESLRKTPADAVLAVEGWVRQQEAAKLRDALKAKGWL